MKIKEKKRMKTPTVSLVTITQNNRFHSFQILYELIKHQTYQNIIEWIIVEGSNSQELASENKKNIKDFLEIHKLSFESKYIEFSGRKLGGLRNLANENSSGDIIVCFDDDDYYPPERVSHAVNKLKESDFLIGGVSAIYLYNFNFDKLFKFEAYSCKHSTNNCMAYKKEYLENHTYNPEACFAEESSFTNNFSEHMVQFNANKTIIVIAHNNNTYNKNDLCSKAMNKEISYLKQVKKDITRYIPEKIFEKMKSIYNV